MYDRKRQIRSNLRSLAAELAGFHDMALAGEGNVSGRISDGRFLVKASGTRMSSLEEDHLVEVDARPLMAAMEAGTSMSDEEAEELLLAARADAQSLKPSVESLFHAWLLQQDGVEYVGHAHPIAVNAVLASPHAEAYASRRLFPDQVVYCGPESVLIPYVDPGLPLALAIAEAVDGYRAQSGILPKTILMKNHGAIVVGPSIDDVAAGLMLAEKSARVYIDAAALGGPDFMAPEQVLRIDGRMDEHYRQRMLRGPDRTFEADRG